MKVFFVKGLKWFDKVNGNTYFNAKVLNAKGETLFYTGFQYGYGSQYVSEARSMLSKYTKAKEIKLVDLGAEYGLKKYAKNGWF